MKIAVATLAIGDAYKNGVRLFQKSLEEYCNKRCYDLLNDISVFDGKREPLWYKVLLIESNLQNYDYIVWIDADIMIMDFTVRLEDLIVNYMKNKDMMLAVDIGNEINTGVWFIKNSTISRYILSAIYSNSELCGNFHEQGVLNKLYEKNIMFIQDNIMIIPKEENRIFNPNYKQYKMGDFLVHFPGVKDPTKLYQISLMHYSLNHDGESDEGRKNRLSLLEQQYSYNNSGYIPKRKSRIGICYFTVGEKYNDNVIKYGLKSIQDYCKKHEYDFIHEKELLNKKLPPHWSKMEMLRKYDDYDFLVWIDADMIIMNDEITIQNLIIDHMGNKDFLLSRDVSGHINTGFWIIRKSKYVNDILSSCLLLPELRYRGCEDQDTFNKLYERNFFGLKERTSILNDCTYFNCAVGLYKWGMFLIHFMSYSPQGLQKAFNDFYVRQKDDENTDQYNYRLSWIKRLNQ